jgi:hypothetical protein
MSITLTSLTDVFAFVLGMMSKIPAVEYFCCYASFSVLFIWIFHFTWYPAMLALDAERVAAKRYNFLCCWSRARCSKLDGAGDTATDDHSISAVGPEDGGTGAAVDKVAVGTVHAKGDSFAAGAAREKEMLGMNIDASAVDRGSQLLTLPDTRARRLMRAHARLILSPRGRISVAGFFLFVTAIFAYLATVAKTGFDLIDLTPDISYLRDHFAAEERLWGSFAGNLKTALYFKDINYGNAQTQADMARLEDDLLALHTVWTDAGIDSWHRAFSTWAAGETAYSGSMQSVGGRGPYLQADAATFGAAVEAFLGTTAGARFQIDVRLASEAGGSRRVVGARTGVHHIVMEESQDQVEGMMETQTLIGSGDGSRCAPGSLLASVSGAEGGGCTVYSYPYTFFDQYRIIKGELFQNFALCLVAIGVLTALIVVHPLLVLLIVVTMFVIDVDLIGMLPVWGLELNSITSINLVMAIGIVVDYSLHIVHSFTLQDTALPRRDRVERALVEIGPSVLLGVATTFLGILPCAFAKSEVFRAFFKMFVGIIVLGSLHGLVIIPVILSVAAPVGLSWNSKIGHADSSVDPIEVVSSRAGFGKTEGRAENK